MNLTFAITGKEMLKELLAQCTEQQQFMFKRMYSHNNLDLPINEAVEKMKDENIDRAITQCERTVENNKIKIA
ncbi:hypothetical protein LCGC14_2243550 [marine sediment metagenome]|uniref:Uncharacterized protein n=1 Tax=marine sediment metagenome TaxID=412755 RepID=A0A0F9DSC3_9ZZZZ